ncbi:MAG TPA: hypothetical protein VGE45_02380 [Chloroflexia bacterium]|jgi:hypothetical protein
MTRENDIIIYQESLPARVSRRTELEFNRQMERIVATAELGMTGMSAMSEVERHAAYKVATTAAAAELLAKGAVAIRPEATATSAEQETQQRLVEDYTRRMGQLAEMTNVKILQAMDRATEQLGKHTLADTLEDFNARLADAIAGQQGGASSIHNGRR